MKSGADPIVEFNKKHRPVNPSTMSAADLIEELIMKEGVKYYVARLRLLKTNINKIYMIVWGQYTKGFEEAIRLDADFKDKSQEFYGFWLLSQIEERHAGIKEVKNSLLLIRDKMTQFLPTRPYDRESSYNYMNRFVANVKALKEIGGKMCYAIQL